MGKTMRQRGLKHWLAAGALAPLLAAGCCSKCATCGGGFVAEGPPPPPAYTYVYAEGPTGNAAGTVSDDGNFLAKVDVPPSKPLALLTAKKSRPAAAELQAVAMATDTTAPYQLTSDQCASDARPVPVAQSPAPFVAQHTQPLPRPAETQPSLKVEPQWSEAVKTDQPVVEAPKAKVHKPTQVERARVPIIILSEGQPLEPVEPAPVELPLMPAKVSEPAKPMAPTPAPTPELVNGHGHAEDYCWLAGEVQFSRGKGWRLRYAGFDEADQYGGSVTLMEHASLETLQDGQMIKVRGRIVNPDGKTIAPPYKVEALEVMAQ